MAHGVVRTSMSVPECRSTSAITKPARIFPGRSRVDGSLSVSWSWYVESPSKALSFLCAGIAHRKACVRRSLSQRFESRWETGSQTHEIPEGGNGWFSGRFGRSRISSRNSPLHWRVRWRRLFDVVVRNAGRAGSG